MTPTGSSTAREDLVVRCASCGAKNRVDLKRLAGSRPKCARCHEVLSVPDPQTAPEELSDANFVERALGSPVPVLVEFYSPYCIYCQKLEPAMARLAVDSGRRLRVTKLDIERNPYTASQFGVRGTPTFVVFDGGREIDRVPGAVPEEQLRYRLHRYLA